MYGNTFYRSMSAIFHMLRHPYDGVRWCLNRLDKKTAIDNRVPWISYSAIDYLDSKIQPGMTVFEYGGGGSTLYFLDKGCSVVTAENSKFWSEQIKKEVDDISKLEIRLVEMSVTPTLSESDLARHYINQIQDGGPWDIVLIDGVDGTPSVRVECARYALTHLKPNGMIILDDSWRKSYSPVPQILEEYVRHEFWGLGPARLGVTKTDVWDKLYNTL